MAAPLYDSLVSLAKSNPLRMHMPGHKGIGEGLFSDITSIDFTEIEPKVSAIFHLWLYPGYLYHAGRSGGNGRRIDFRARLS